MIVVIRVVKSRSLHKIIYIKLHANVYYYKQKRCSDRQNKQNFNQTNLRKIINFKNKYMHAVFDIRREHCYILCIYAIKK